MNHIPEWRVAMVAIFSSLALLTSGAAADQKQGTVIAESKVEVQAIVKEIELEKRTVTLAMPDGSLQTFVVDDGVKRFDKVQRGDVVKATYNQIKSVTLRKTKVKPNVTIAESLTRDPDSIKPAGVSERRVTTVATIERIAADFRSVSLRMPDGTLQDVDVRNR